jgi:hypothetical protein
MKKALIINNFDIKPPPWSQGEGTECTTRKTAAEEENEN